MEPGRHARAEVGRTQKAYLIRFVAPSFRDESTYSKAVIYM
jgi:hypothetical protein